MRRNDALPSKYLNAADIGQNIYKLVISNIVMEKMDNDGAMKPVMYFNNAQKAMVVNATNWDNMASIYEDESNNWIGKTIEMYTEATRMPNGQPGRGIRIRPMAGAQTANALNPTVQAPLGPGEQAAVVANSEPIADELDDEIPF